MSARASVAALVRGFDSKAETWWNVYGPALLSDEIGTPVVETRYHWMTVHLPGGSYTPDFYHILEDGREVLVEIKGSKAQKNYRDARSKLRAAADLGRQWLWYECRVDGHGNFELERIEVK